MARTKELGRNGEPLCAEENTTSLVTSYISYTQNLFCFYSLDPLRLNCVNSPHLGPYFQFLLFPKKLPASLRRPFMSSLELPTSLAWQITSAYVWYQPDLVAYS